MNIFFIIVLLLLLIIAYNYFTQNKKRSYGPWSIGIYEGNTLFDLQDPKDVSNPVLTGKSVNDIDAKFVADPFMILKDDTFFMFFEAMNRETKQGEIGYAKSQDGKNWHYGKIVIDEKFHVSYPYVFKWKEEYYLIPESHEDFSVRLYKARSFPETWEYQGNLLSGYRYLDPSIFHHEGKWWMFVSTGKNNVLNLYYSYELRTGWKPHPMNPIVKHNGHTARSGGRVTLYKNTLYRLAQDDDPTYGIQVFAFEITMLSENIYEEKIVPETSIVTESSVGWNARGMHHADPHKVGNTWLSTVDGRDK